MRGLASRIKARWLCSRLAGIEMESEIPGEFQCVARFVLGKPFSGSVEVSDGGSAPGIEVDDELDKLAKVRQASRCESAFQPSFILINSL